MSEEDNPFIVKKKPEDSIANKDESFGTDELVSFMVSDEEAKTLKETKPKSEYAKPNWEEAGTPVWDRKGANLENPDMEIVEHKLKKKENEI